MDNREHIEYEEYKEELDSFINQAKEKRTSLINEDNEEDKITLEDSDSIDVEDIIITHFDKKEEEVMPIKKPKERKKIKNTNQTSDILSKKNSVKLALLSLLFIPGLFVLFMVGTHSNYLIRPIFFFIISFLLVAGIILFGYSIYCFNKNTEPYKRIFKKFVKSLLIGFYSLYILGCCAFIILLYGPNKKFKDWYVTTAMASMNHQYLCYWFYGEADIKDVRSRNYMVEPEGNTDPSKINIDPKPEKEKEPEYNEYEKQIMIHEKDERYKIITFDVNGATAYLAAIYNPKDVSVVLTNQVRVSGEYATHMAARTPGSYLGINAGGYIDNGNAAQSGGQYPNGIVIVDGEIITNNEYGTPDATGGVIGLTDEGVLVLLKGVSAQEAIDMGVKDAVSWGPFLIVNGESAQVSGNGGFGGGARTAIGQRKDGTILFLVVDSNASRTTGAEMQDLVKIMENYGAYNASNLDGGTSSVMVAPRDVAINTFGRDCHDYFSDTFCYINDPINIVGNHQTRYIATTFVAAYVPSEDNKKK